MRLLLKKCFLVIECLGAAAVAGPRLDQIQVIGTHNSYHIAPHPSLGTLIRRRNAEQATALEYSHRALRDQLDRLGMRQIELDLYADPHGGLFAEPAGIRLAAEEGLPAVPPPDPAIMKAPGIKILHSPDFDFQSTVLTLRGALQQLFGWSTNRPGHVPVFVLLELKDVSGSDHTSPVPWSRPLLEAMEAEILSVVPAELILRPDDVRGGLASLREAVHGRGWPPLANARSKFVFLLDNTDEVRELYLAGNPRLEGRLLFPSVSEDHPAAAWFKINDPVREGTRIQRLVREGFLVRTRADANTIEARQQDVHRRDAAMQSGAQLISTDFPEPQPSWGNYEVRWPDGIVARPNPVGASVIPPDTDLEELAVSGLEPFAPAELQWLNFRAFRYHRNRSLTDASADYTRLLELDPPRAPTEVEARVLLNLAPLLRTLVDEPFPLQDIVAIHHPSRPLVGYHLFWSDDIDFPDDNDPIDHEVVWVHYEPVSGRALNVHTYFHGRLLTAPGPDRGGRPEFAIEWGKHGSLPMNSGRVVAPALLRSHWERLHDRGIRMATHPLARHWPKRFEGDWEAYQRFDRAVDPRGLLERLRLTWVSLWPNAVLDQFALPYNFAPKTEWPE
jgi:hypothetical protein